MIKIRFAFNLNGYNMELQNEACEWGSLQAAVYVIPPVLSLINYLTKGRQRRETSKIELQ